MSVCTDRTRTDRRCRAIASIITYNRHGSVWYTRTDHLCERMIYDVIFKHISPDYRINWKKRLSMVVKE